MTVYVQRAGGVIVGVYAVPQPGLAEEAIDDGDPAVVAYRAGPTAAALLAAARSAAAGAIQSLKDQMTIQDRGVALAAGLTGDNAIRAWINSFVTAVAASTSLANLQTRVATLGGLPLLTAADVKTAVVNRINNQEAD